MHDVANLILAIIGAVAGWTTSVVVVVLWLSNKFRSLEGTVYRETGKIRHEIDKQNIRIQRVELKVFGFTPTSFPPE